MYRISSDLDLNEIIGSEIEQICSGQYDVQFRFHSGTSIAVQGEVSVLDGKIKVGVWNEEANWSSLAFQRLLNVRIVKYSVPNDRLLEIGFENGWILQIHDNSDQHESFQITKKDEEKIIVV